MKINRPNILLLNTTFKKEGPNTLLLELVRHLDHSRYRVIAACMHECGPVADVYRSLGIKTHNFGMECFLDLNAIGRIAKFIKEFNIHLVHAQLLRAEVFGGFSAWLAETPLVFSILNTDPYRRQKRYLTRYVLSRLSMSFPTCIVASSASVRDYLITHQSVESNRIVLIPNSVDPVGYNTDLPKAECRERFNLRKEDCVVTTVARLHKQKGLSYLLKAAAQVIKVQPQITFFIVGNGPEDGLLKSLAVELGISKHVIFAGWRSDLPEIYKASDLFCLPSVYEGLPMALLGAMASGLPAVVSNVSGNREVVDDGESGFVVPSKDHKLLADRILRLVKNTVLRERMGVSAKVKIVDHYNASAMAKLYQRVYDNCLAKRAKVKIIR